MIEPTEEPLLTEAEAPAETKKTKTTARKTAAKTAKPKATKAAKAPAKAEKEAKPRGRKKTAATTEAEAEEASAKGSAETGKAAAPANGSAHAPAVRRGRSRQVVTVLPPGAGVEEEWSPSSKRRESAAPEGKKETAKKEVEQPAAEPAPVKEQESAPVEGAKPAEPAAAEAAAPEAAPAADTGGARRYPVYIPRHLAKQLEAEGKEAPIAVTSEAEVPKEVLAAALAAKNTQPPTGRPPQQHRQPAERPAQAAEAPVAATPEPEQPAAVVVTGVAEGIVEISGKGFGFIRSAKRDFAQTPNDIFVTPETVRTFNLRDGQWIKGETRRGNRGEQLHRLLEINGEDPEKCKALPVFDELTVINPNKRINLETTPERYTTRVIDLMAPIGKGQRGLIVAPPRTGKTTLLHHIAEAVIQNHPEIHLLILLVDERPEEVTEFRRSVPKAEIMASSNDLDVKSHTRIAQLAIERAKRLVEQGRDVFILLDSITRVGRAFNNALHGGGRTGSGGLDNRALEIPRRLFAAARNTEEAGSLTIVATALIETNSRMDEVIFQEFKGTGNMELMLARNIAEQRIYPAVDIFLSGTRREELLIGEDDLHKINVIRRGLSGAKPIDAIERLLFFMKRFPTNGQMLREIPG